MKITFNWKHVDQSDAAETYAQEKLQKMEKYLHNVISCEMSFEMIHGSIHANLNLHADGANFNAHNEDKEIHSCIDGLEAKLERQLSKFHDKKTSHQ